MKTKLFPEICVKYAGYALKFAECAGFGQKGEVCRKYAEYAENMRSHILPPTSCLIQGRGENATWEVKKCNAKKCKKMQKKCKKMQKSASTNKIALKTQNFASKTFIAGSRWSFSPFQCVFMTFHAMLIPKICFFPKNNFSKNRLFSLFSPPKPHFL